MGEKQIFFYSFKMIFFPIIKARVYKFINPFFLNLNDVPSILKGKNEICLGADKTQSHSGKSKIGVFFSIIFICHG